MGDTTYPVDNVTPVRARDMIQRCNTRAQLADTYGMTDGAWAHVAGEGLWRYEAAGVGIDTDTTIVPTEVAGLWHLDIKANRDEGSALLDCLGW